MNKLASRLAVLAVACMLCFSVAACGSSKQTADSQQTNQVTATETQAKTAK